MYRISKTVSVDAEFPIAIHATRNFENGYIEIGLEGKLLEKETVVNYIH
jgi:hypothetical protein